MVVEGVGTEHELLVLGMVAGPAATGKVDGMLERMTAGTDVMSCPLAIDDRWLYLAALGERVSRMPEAARGVARILHAS